jgi:AcrR family transcriptional regulator
VRCARMVQPANTPDGEDRGPDWELPRGRHRLPRQTVANHQRARLLAAVPEAVAAHGYAGLTVEHVVSIAGVSRPTFYANFANKREAVEVAHELVFARFRERLLSACSAQAEWPFKVKVAIGATLDAAAAAPAEAQLLVLDLLASERSLARQAFDARDNLAGLLSSGRRHAEHGAALPPLTEQALIGGLVGAISTRLLHGEAKRLPELAPQLVQFTLLPYLGHAAAERIAIRPRPGLAERP